MPTKRILLVEDDLDLAPVLAITLQSEGYSVDIARTLEQARARFDEGDYSLVLADLRLPDGNGLEVAERAAAVGVKTAIVSGYLHELSAGSARHHEIMVKPVRPIEMISTVRRLIGEAAS